MVAVTSNWEIPYAQSTDPFCDGAEITQAMAERIDEILDAQDLSLGTLQRPAYASISVTTPAPTEEFRVRYDTTDEDTANLVDLALDPFSIYPNEAGIWLTGVSVSSSTSAAGATETWNSGRYFDAMQTDQAQTIREDANARSVSSLSAGLVYDPDDDDYRMDTNFVNSGVTPPSVVISIGRFWAWRYSDLP